MILLKKEYLTDEGLALHRGIGPDEEKVTDIEMVDQVGVPKGIINRTLYAATSI